MHLQRWLAFGTLLAAALHAHAGQPTRAPDPADPAAAVPPTVYQSAMTGYTPAPKDVPAPDKAWRAANATVAGQPGHAGHHGPAPEGHKDAPPAKPAPAHAPHQQH
jgi:hypothetical protein